MLELKVYALIFVIHTLVLPRITVIFCLLERKLEKLVIIFKNILYLYRLILQQNSFFNHKNKDKDYLKKTSIR